MNESPNISGRPTDAEIATFTGELGPSPVDKKVLDEIQEGWTKVGVRTDRDLFEFFNNTTFAEQLDKQYDSDGWGVVAHGDGLLDIFANTSESHEAVDTDAAEAKELGHVAVDDVVESPEREE